MLELSENQNVSNFTNSPIFVPKNLLKYKFLPKKIYVHVISTIKSFLGARKLERAKIKRSPKIKEVKVLFICFFCLICYLQSIKRIIVD